MQIITPKNQAPDNLTGEKMSNNKVGLHVISEASGVAWDSITPTYPNSVTEVYTYSFLGEATRVVTVVYTDSTKEVLSSIVRV